MRKEPDCDNPTCEWFHNYNGYVQVSSPWGNDYCSEDCKERHLNQMQIEDQIGN